MSPALYSSATNEWPTPRAFFAKLNRRHQFTLDPCATAENATCPVFFTKEDDGLTQDWETHSVFCNPPYGRKIGAWVRKCFEASQGGALVVLLVPARTDTRWFHDWCFGKADVEFIQRRLRFGEANASAPFPSMLAVYSPTGQPGSVPLAATASSPEAMHERAAVRADNGSIGTEIVTPYP